MVKTYFYPNLGFRFYRQHSALIPSVADLHLKLARSLCIVQIPGSNRLHTQSTMQYHNKGHFITRMIQVQSILLQIAQLKAGSRVTAENN